MCVQEPCVYLLSAASVVIRNNTVVRTVTLVTCYQHCYTGIHKLATATRFSHYFDVTYVYVLLKCYSYCYAIYILMHCYSYCYTCYTVLTTVTLLSYYYTVVTFLFVLYTVIYNVTLVTVFEALLTCYS